MRDSLHIRDKHYEQGNQKKEGKMKTLKARLGHFVAIFIFCAIILLIASKSGRGVL
jgi:hypothetical protein